MFGSEAASRRFLRVRRVLISLEIVLLLFTMVAPVGTMAADVTPPPSSPALLPLGHGRQRPLTNLCLTG